MNFGNFDPFRGKQNPFPKQEAVDVDSEPVKEQPSYQQGFYRSGPRPETQNPQNPEQPKAAPQEPVQMKPRKPVLPRVLTVLIVLILLMGLSGAQYTVRENQYAYVTRFSQMVNVVGEPGLHFKVPYIDQVRYIPSYQMIYDIEPSEVITADKKTLVVDNFAIWSISDPAKYMRAIGGSQSEMEGRISASVYSSVKNEFGRLYREEIINTDPRSVEQVSRRVTDTVNQSLASYGITIKAVEIKRTDLPNDNAEAVYQRMITEREKIATSYIADGELQAAKIRNEVDRQAKTILAQAQAESDKLNGEAEAEYMRILSSAYASPEKAEFYQFQRALDALKSSMKGDDRTLILDQDSYIVRVLLGQNVN